MAAMDRANLAFGGTGQPLDPAQAMAMAAALKQQAGPALLNPAVTGLQGQPFMGPTGQPLDPNAANALKGMWVLPAGLVASPLLSMGSEGLLNILEGQPFNGKAPGVDVTKSPLAKLGRWLDETPGFKHVGQWFTNNILQKSALGSSDCNKAVAQLTGVYPALQGAHNHLQGEWNAFLEDLELPEFNTPAVKAALQRADLETVLLKDVPKNYPQWARETLLSHQLMVNPHEFKDTGLIKSLLAKVKAAQPEGVALPKWLTSGSDLDNLIANRNPVVFNWLKDSLAKNDGALAKEFAKETLDAPAYLPGLNSWFATHLDALPKTPENLLKARLELLEAAQKHMDTSLEEMMEIANRLGRAKGAGQKMVKNGQGIDDLAQEIRGLFFDATGKLKPWAAAGELNIPVQQLEALNGASGPLSKKQVLDAIEALHKHMAKPAQKAKILQAKAFKLRLQGFLGRSDDMLGNYFLRYAKDQKFLEGVGNKGFWGRTVLGLERQLKYILSGQIVSDTFKSPAAEAKWDASILGKLGKPFKPFQNWFGKYAFGGFAVFLPAILATKDAENPWDKAKSFTRELAGGGIGWLISMDLLRRLNASFGLGVKLFGPSASRIIIPVFNGTKSRVVFELLVNTVLGFSLSALGRGAVDLVLGKPTHIKNEEAKAKAEKLQKQTQQLQLQELQRQQQLQAAGVPVLPNAWAKPLQTPSGHPSLTNSLPLAGAQPLVSANDSGAAPGNVSAAGSGGLTPEQIASSRPAREQVALAQAIANEP